MAKVATLSQTDTTPSFEELLARLGSVVERLEAGDLPLEKSLELFEEGVRLSRLGSARLDEAERRVERLLSDGDAVTTEPRDVEARGAAREQNKEISGS